MLAGFAGAGFGGGGTATGLATTFGGDGNGFGVGGRTTFGAGAGGGGGGGSGFGVGGLIGEITESAPPLFAGGATGAGEEGTYSEMSGAAVLFFSRFLRSSSVFFFISSGRRLMSAMGINHHLFIVPHFSLSSEPFDFVQGKLREGSFLSFLEITWRIPHCRSE